MTSGRNLCLSMQANPSASTSGIASPSFAATQTWTFSACCTKVSLSASALPFRRVKCSFRQSRQMRRSSHYSTAIQPGSQPSTMLTLLTVCLQPSSRKAGSVRSLEAMLNLHAASQIVVGKLGVVVSPDRPPRLVVDSSVSGVTSNTHLPNKAPNPSLADVRKCLPLCPANESLAALVLDVSKAHRRVRISLEDQGLLCFRHRNVLYPQLWCSGLWFLLEQGCWSASAAHTPSPALRPNLRR